MSTVRNQPGKHPSPSEGKRPAREKSDQAAGWSRWARIVVSLLILWHLFAVFIAPFSMPPSSQFSQNIALSKPVSWYLGPLYLHHGYGFFAPDPGASLLVRYRVVGEDGREIEGHFPDLEKQWPRLRYHRYLMLADQAKLPIGSESMEQRAQAMMRVYARQLLREFDGTEARVEHVRHHLLRPVDVLPSENGPGTKLDDPRTYEVLSTQVQTARDLEVPLKLPHLATENLSWQSREPSSMRSGP